MPNIRITRVILLALALVFTAEAAGVDVRSDYAATPAQGGKWVGNDNGDSDGRSRLYTDGPGLNTSSHNSRGVSKVQGSHSSTPSPWAAKDRNNRKGEYLNEQPKKLWTRKFSSLGNENSVKNADQTSKSQSGADPQPSPRARNRQQKKKDPRDMTSRELANHVCPGGLFGCPISEPGSLSELPANLTSLLEQGFECVDLKADLKACGGCASVNKVHDCTTIPGVQGVSCEDGTCIVLGCEPWLALDPENNVCIFSG